MPEAVKLQCRKVRGSEQYTVTVPKGFIGELKWQKGDILFATIKEVDVNGKIVKALIYYKP